jgi:hypothetical protein
MYDPYSAAFLGGDFYDPIFHFNQKELISKWQEIFSLLSIEKVRERVESILIKHYEKLAESSLDKSYPNALWNKIGKNRVEISKNIEKHCIKLKLKEIDTFRDKYYNTLKNLTSLEILNQAMEYPLGMGKTDSEFYLEKRLKEISTKEIFNELIKNFERDSIFKKEQKFVALSILYNEVTGILKDNIKKWLLERKDGILNKLNRNETIMLRIFRKIFIINFYPKLREKIEDYIKNAPEIIRFIQKPNALDLTYETELIMHKNYFKELLSKTEEELDKQYIELDIFEKKLDLSFSEAYKNLKREEKQFMGFEYYGKNGVQYSFKIILTNYGVI